MRKLGCDFFACSGHKMLGPTGVGVLWGRPEVLEEMDPFMGGGEMIREVISGSLHLERPALQVRGRNHERRRRPWALAPPWITSTRSGPGERQGAREGARRVRLPGGSRRSKASPCTVPREERTGLVSFSVPDVHPHDLSQLLDEEGVAIRSGHHCAQPLMRRLGVAATARASFYLYNTAEEVDALVEALVRAREFFAAFSGAKP